MSEGATELTPDEMAAFDGLEESYRLMDAAISAIAPRCHFRPMFMDEDDSETWWACSVCGHTKALEQWRTGR